MNIAAKQRVREMVAANTPPPNQTVGRTPVEHESVRTPSSDVLPDELVLEITSNIGTSSITLRPSEVSRLRGRYGRGPGFEKWVADRIRDAMITFGGG